MTQHNIPGVIAIGAFAARPPCILLRLQSLCPRAPNGSHQSSGARERPFDFARRQLDQRVKAPCDITQFEGF